MGNDISEPLKKKKIFQTPQEARVPPSCAYLNGKTTLRPCVAFAFTLVWDNLCRNVCMRRYSNDALLMQVARNRRLGF